jgi:hypothetical protein
MPVQCRGQLGQFALGAAALDMAVYQRGDARAVIPTIFQAAQAIQK